MCQQRAKTGLGEGQGKTNGRDPGGRLGGWWSESSKEDLVAKLSAWPDRRRPVRGRLRFQDAAQQVTEE